MLKLDWIKCQDQTWCDLQTVDLDSQHFEGLEGVYVIWHGGNDPRTVRVGQGVIRDRLQKHRTDQEILNYKNLGLYATWAEVSPGNRDGIERFLAETLKPLIGSTYPEARPIEVNLPW